jgi:hypothetical protein
MKKQNKEIKSDQHKKHGKQGKIALRPDLEDARKGKDLAYLNELPQMGGYEGVKAGVPPPEKKPK